MGFDLVEIGSFGRIFIKDFVDKGLELVTEELRKNTLAFEYFFVGDILILGLKRSCATGQLI